MSGFRSSSDSEFQVAGAATAKARRPYVSSWTLGRRASCGAGWTDMLSFNDLSDQRTHYTAWPWRHLYAIQPSLHVTRSATSSQCSSVRRSCVKPRSYFRAPLTIRAAAFIQPKLPLTFLTSLLAAACRWQSWEASWKHCNVKHKNL